FLPDQTIRTIWRLPEAPRPSRNTSRGTAAFFRGAVLSPPGAGDGRSLLRTRRNRDERPAGRLGSAAPGGDLRRFERGGRRSPPLQVVARRPPGDRRKKFPELRAVPPETAVMREPVPERQPHARRIGIHLPGVQIDDRRGAASVAAG